MLTLGRYGVWLNPVYDDPSRIDYAVEAEALGYGAVWLGLGQRDESDLRLVEQVLDAILLPTELAHTPSDTRRLSDNWPEAGWMWAWVRERKAVQSAHD